MNQPLKIPWWNVDLGPEAAEAVARAVRDRQISHGRLVEEFEGRVGELLGLPFVTAVTSGTSALMLALMEAGVGPGDEVIVPDVTWIATAHAVLLLGAKVVLADIEPDRPVINPEAAARAVSPRTRAIIPVHWNGRACDLPALMELAERHNLALIEDAAQALCSRAPDGSFLGTVGHSGCFSLSVAKLITAGQGGLVVTRDPARAKRLKLMRTHGVDSVMAPNWGLWGGNFRLTGLQAALALSQLDRLENRIEGFLRTYNTYAEGLADNELFRLDRPQEPRRELPVSVEAHSPRRAALTAHFQERGLEVRELYAPLHQAPQLGPQTGPFPQAELYAGQSLFLPGGPDRGDGELAQVIAAVKEWIAHEA